MAWLILAAVCFLAYSNGANDNFKGVASLYGSRTVSYKTALRWATVTTLLGSVASFFLASTLLGKFTGKGLVPDSLASSESFILAIAIGAAVTVIIATFTGFPVSTTHALTGAILGAGLVAVGGNVGIDALGRGFTIPLLLSPILAVAIGSIMYLGAHFTRKASGVNCETCLCVGQEFVPISAGSASLAYMSSPTLTIDQTAGCVERYDGRLLGISVQDVVDAGHFLSSGVVSFARGLNDTPKIMALLLVVGLLDLKFGWALVAVSIAIGGLVSSRKVAETMSNKITTMNTGQAFTANLTTGLLVIGASFLGFPVSTTHVSVGSLFGIGLITKQANLRVVSGIMLSWVVTLPIAALLSATAFLLISKVN